MPDLEVTLWPPSFDAAIFDFDGTIALTGDIWAEVDRVFLAARGAEPTAEYLRMLPVLGLEAGARYTIETYGLEETVENVCEEWAMMSSTLLRQTVGLRPGVEGYLEALRTCGIRCALATNNWRAVLERMELMDVPSLFEVRVYGNEIGAQKDRPDIYLEAARHLGVAPERCIVFEDIAPGLLAARSASFQTCAVRSHEKSQDWPWVSSCADVALLGWEGITVRGGEGAS